jgi:hypothetical protein
MENWNYRTPEIPLLIKDRGTLQLLSHPIEVFNTETGEVVCDLISDGNWEDKDLQRAKLIASAPLLLDRLIKCERIMNNMADQLSEVGLQYLGQASQAINKATT